MCGRRSTGSPRTSTSGIVAGTLARMRSIERAVPRRRLVALGLRRRAATPRPPRRRAGRARRAPGRPHARPRGRASATGCRCGRPARRRPGRPTSGRRRPAPTSRRAVDVPEGLRGVDDERSVAKLVGDVVDRLVRADLVVGRLQRGGGRRRPPLPRRRRRRRRPGRGGRPATESPSRRAARAARRVQHGRVLDRAVHDRVLGARRLPASVPSTAACSACVPFAAKLTSSGRAPIDVGDRLAGGVEQQPGAAAGAVEPGRIGPAVVKRGEQRLPRDRVQRRTRCRVEDSRHARR